LATSFRREFRTESEVQLSILAAQLLEQWDVVGIVRARIALLRKDTTALGRSRVVAGAEQS